MNSKKFITGMSLLLVLGLAGCGAENPAGSSEEPSKPDPIINVIPVEKTVNVTADAVEGANVVIEGEGKQQDGSFLPGTKAVAKIEVTAAGKIVDWVDVNGTRIVDKDGDGEYAFTIPNADCVVSVTLVDGIPEAAEIADGAYPSVAEEDIEDPEKVYGAFEKVTAALKKSEAVNQKYEAKGKFAINNGSSIETLNPAATVLGLNQSGMTAEAEYAYEVGSNDVLVGKGVYKQYSKLQAVEFEEGKMGDNNFYRSIQTLAQDTSGINLKYGKDEVDLQRIVDDDMTDAQGFVAADMTRKSEAEGATYGWIVQGLLNTYLSGTDKAMNGITKTEKKAEEGEESSSSSEASEPVYEYAFAKDYKLTKFASALSEDKKSVTIEIEDEYDQKDLSYNPYVAKRSLSIVIDGSGFLKSAEYHYAEYDASKIMDGVYSVAEVARKVNTFSFSAEKGQRSMKDKIDMEEYCLKDGYSLSFNYKLDVDGKTQTIASDGTSMQIGGKVEVSSHSSSPFVMTPAEDDEAKTAFVQPIFLGIRDEDAECLKLEKSYPSSIITAVKKGTVELQFDNGIGHVSTFEVEITDVLPFEINAALSSSTAFLGDSLTLEASISPKDASQALTVAMQEEDPTASEIKENDIVNDDGTITKHWTITPTALGQTSVVLTATDNPKVKKTLEFGVYEKPTYEAIHKAMIEKSYILGADTTVHYTSNYGYASTSDLKKDSSFTFSEYGEGLTYGEVKFVEKGWWKDSTSTYYYQLDQETLGLTLSISNELDADGKLQPSKTLEKTSFSGYLKVLSMNFITEGVLEAGITHSSVTKEGTAPEVFSFVAGDRIA